MASKRRLRRKACIGKVRHETEEIARYVAFKMRKQTGAYIIHYGCKYCGGFHIGHPPKHVRNRISSQKGV